MQVIGLKIDNPQGVKSEKQWPFTYFSTNILARMERNSERYCKIKDKDLSFWVDELMSL